VAVDFNTAYNPPCALNEFATCPLPRSRTAWGCAWRRARRSTPAVPGIRS